MKANVADHQINVMQTVLSLMSKNWWQNVVTMWDYIVSDSHWACSKLAIRKTDIVHIGDGFP